MISHWALVVSGFAVVGCGRGGDRVETTRDTIGMMGHMDSGGMGEMDSGHPGMGGMKMSAMRAHMDSMMRMSPQQMQGMMARHEQMMSHMMDGMGSDMRGMNMSGTPEWSGLTDSVKRDLADLPNLKGQELSTRMRAHADRVRRLIAMHEKMMAR
jgi:hypothetical protein